MWFERGVRLGAVVALLIIVLGLLVLALPETMEGQELVHLSRSHGLRLADLVGVMLLGVGTVLAWGAVWAWQRVRIHG